VDHGHHGQQWPVRRIIIRWQFLERSLVLSQTQKYIKYIFVNPVNTFAVLFEMFFVYDYMTPKWQMI